MEKPYYTQNEILKIFNVTSKTLQNWKDKNIIKFTQIGSEIYYDKEYINNFFKINNDFNILLNKKINQIIAFFEAGEEDLESYQYKTSSITKILESFKT